MTGIAKTVGVLCVSVMAMGILYDLGNFKATDKTLKFVISIYIIATVFNSFRTAKLEFDTDISGGKEFAGENPEILKEKIVLQTEKELTELIKKRMEEKNISYNSISLHILEQNGSIQVDRINIDCPSDMQTAVMDCIRDIISEDTQIITGE